MTAKTSTKEPKYLYHGSMFSTDGEPLYPGIHHTGKLVVWDGGLETNEFLYTTTDAKHAILLGLGSLLEKKLNTTRYQIRGDSIIVYGGPKGLSMDDLKDQVVYLYTILFKKRDGWYKNENPYNGIDTEWKTTHSIDPSHFVMVELPMGEWLAKNGYRVTFKHKDERE